MDQSCRTPGIGDKTRSRRQARKLRALPVIPENGRTRKGAPDDCGGYEDQRAGDDQNPAWSGLRRLRWGWCAGRSRGESERASIRVAEPASLAEREAPVVA